MKYAELTRKLRRLGCDFTRFGAGGHKIWRNPMNGKQASIPNHKSKGIGSQLLSRILHQLGIDRHDFDQA